jgi:hypothetical protein
MTAIDRYFKQKTAIAPLVFFRICFGLLMFVAIIRFWSNGWIQSLYIDPVYHFSFYGFECIKPMGAYTYLIFLVCALSALMVAAGLFFRVASVLMFLSFTYIELMDKATYLNHYYFISLVCLLLMFLPANRSFSLDVRRNRQLEAGYVPSWHVDALKLMMGIVYVYAGLAKLNSDWLLHALPLKIWLPARNDMPLIGPLFNYEPVAYIFSWLGCLYDLSIPFLLLNKRTRPFAYIAVIVFHVFTAMLFPIGMFPHIMIVVSLIFFSARFHQNILDRISALLGRQKKYVLKQVAVKDSMLMRWCFIVFFMIQLLLPFRYLAYPGELFWTEEGYRFSWRVMLMEKAGYAQFTVKDPAGTKTVVNNPDFLTPLQEKMMSTQPDMLLQYAQFLRDHYQEAGFRNAEVYVDSYVALNGRIGQPLVGPDVNLAAQSESFRHKTWINPFNDEIKGF